MIGRPLDGKEWEYAAPNYDGPYDEDDIPDVTERLKNLERFSRRREEELKEDERALQRAQRPQRGGAAEEWQGKYLVGVLLIRRRLFDSEDAPVAPPPAGEDWTNALYEWIERDLEEPAPMPPDPERGIPVTGPSLPVISIGDEGWQYYLPIEVVPNSRLHWLANYSEALARILGIPPGQVVVSVLIGFFPPPLPLDGVVICGPKVGPVKRVEGSFLPWIDIRIESGLRSEIVVRARSPYVTPDDVAHAYSFLRQRHKAWLKRARLDSGWLDALSAFVARSPGLSWDERRRAWNKEYPDHQYLDANSTKAVYFKAKRRHRPAGGND